MKVKIKKVLLLGSGALKIGEAGEFDYSGTQAIKALKEEGVQVILVNPNVATIQTSEELADKVYFLPVQSYFVERVIAKEKPDSILLSFGGQTALNCGITLHREGILKKYGVTILGTPIEAIIATEDREIFALRLKKIGLSAALGTIVGNVAQGLTTAGNIGYPVMLRTGFALGGTGSGVAKDEAKLEELLTNAFATGSQVIIEESLAGWKEVEYEVVRDRDDNCITVCNMENFDPVGIHTGESIVIAPSQTLNNQEYFRLRQASIDVIRDLKIVGECNIQFALHPKSNELRVIEVNARLSRSSALASKATGYPLAYVAAKLALGHTLPTLRNRVTGKTSAFFEPALDYVVVKIPRWDLEKYEHVIPAIGSEMKSVGEVMSIGRSFEEAIQKGARMLNDGYEGVIDKRYGNVSKAVLRKLLTRPDTMRLFTVCSAIRAGISVGTIYKLTKIDRWFLDKLSSIVSLYRQLDGTKRLDKTLLAKSKQYGFSDKQIGDLMQQPAEKIRQQRKLWNVVPRTLRIDTMAGEFPAITNYLYMTYNALSDDHVPNPKERKVMVLGCGPYAVGTSVEFDWCAVNTVAEINKQGIKSILVNCNPETVSTDFDTADYLYFEELTLERVLDICDREEAPVVVSVGGQIPNNLAAKLASWGVPLLGTPPAFIQQAEERDAFSTLLDTLGLKQPAWGKARSPKEVIALANKIGYPILLRPSFVLSGKGMNILENKEQLVSYMKTYPIELTTHPLVLTKFLPDAVECDFDGVAKDGHLELFAISEHVEHGGIHSGDSTLMLPAPTLSGRVQKDLRSAAEKIIMALHVAGPFNIQFLIHEGVSYVIECNLRASRSIPFVSKTLHTNFIGAATQIMLGTYRARDLPIPTSYVAVKVPQFSFHKLRGADPVLRVEMRSTGEVCAFGRDVYEAYLTALAATGVRYPEKKAAFISLGGAKGKMACLTHCKKLASDGYTLYATSGTALFLKEYGISSIVVYRLHQQGRPNFVDLAKEKQIDFAIVTPEGYNGDVAGDLRGATDGYLMRRMAIDTGIPIFTNTESACHYIDAITQYNFDQLSVKSWQEYKEI